MARKSGNSSNEAKELPQYTIPAPSNTVTEQQVRDIVSEMLNNMTGVQRVMSGQLQSGNFKPGSAGWQLSADGELQLNSNDGTGLENRIGSGLIEFLKSGTDIAYIKTGSDGISLQLSCSVIIYFTDLAGVPNISFGQTGIISFSGETGAINWPSGRKITSTGSALVANGDFNVTGSYGSNGHYSNTGHISEANVDTFSIEIRNGIIINFNKNS